MIYRLICLVCMVVGYFFGTFQTAYIIGRIKNVDVRKKGSGNLGTTNMFRVLGIKAGIVTFFGDILKVFVAAAIAYIVIIMSLKLPIDRIALFLYTGFGVVLGHDFPFYLKFKGGKGVAATAAVLISVWDWRMIVAGVVIFFVIAVSTQYVSLASMALCVSEFFIFLILYLLGFLKLDPAWLPDCLILIAIMALLVIWQHRKNIARLRNGTENKFRFMSEKEIKEQENGQEKKNG